MRSIAVFLGITKVPPSPHPRTAPKRPIPNRVKTKQTGYEHLFLIDSILNSLSLIKFLKKLFHASINKLNRILAKFENLF